MNVAVPSKKGASSSIDTQAFDVLFDEARLLQLLVAIRGSSIPKNEKMDLRDLVLEFSQTSDPATQTEIKNNITKVLAEHSDSFTALLNDIPASKKMAPLVELEDVEEKVVMGRMRPVPSFAPVPAYEPISTATPAPSKETKESAHEPVVAPTVAEKKKTVPDLASTPKNNTSTKKPLAAEKTVSKSPTNDSAAVSIPIKKIEVTSQGGEQKKSVDNVVLEEKQPPTTTPAPAVPASAPAPKSVPAPTPAPTSATPASVAPPVTHKERIIQIKRLVNSKVGNPVNLMEQDSDIGREYMNALLDAMKVVSGGVAGDPDGVMARLETSYRSVENLLATITPVSPKAEKISVVKTQNQDTTPPEKTSEKETPVEKNIPEKGKAEKVSTPDLLPTQAPVVSVPTEVLPEEKTTDLPPQVPAQPSVSPLPPPPPVSDGVESKKLTPVTPTQKSVSETKAPNSPVPAQEKQESKFTQSPETVLQDIGIAETKELKTDVAKKEIQEKPTRLSSLTSKLMTGTPVTGAKLVPPPQNPPQPPVTETEPGLQSVATQKTKQEKAVEQKRAESVKKAPVVEVAVDKFHTHEVNTGLDQLLSEWKLFQSSGIFGTGPSGKEHPLYLKLAGLPMAAVISGRFEGATPEVKQSLTDYMNGWRYEQGVVHEMGEVFEAYLRRVITEILESAAKTGQSKTKQEA